MTTTGSSNPKPTVSVFTDGACLGDGRGGWAAILQKDGAETLISGGFSNTNAHRMEMMGVVRALEFLTIPSKVTVYTDSRNVQAFIAAGGVKLRRVEPKHSDLRRRVFAAMARHSISAVWIKGHAGHAENERCDQAAGREARALNLPADPGYGPHAVAEGMLFAL